MAFVAPITWSSQLVTVAQFNEQIRDNMRALKDPPSGLSYVSARNYQVAGVGAWTAIDTGLVDGHFQHTITVVGDRVKCEFRGSLNPKTNNGELGFNVAVDGVEYFPGAGIHFIDPTAQSAATIPLFWEAILTGITAGSHVFRVDWSATHTAFTLYGSGVANRFTPPMWYVVEAP